MDDDFRSSRDKNDAQDCLGPMGHLPIQRLGTRRAQMIISRRPVDLDDCSTQEISIRHLCFAAVDYAGAIPMSLELHQILDCAKTEENTRFPILHLSACLRQTEYGVRPPLLLLAV